ncbi:MAG: response regulator [Cyanobacteria bacterium P01_A01_bin.135]
MLKVLLVEDNEANRDMLSRRLQRKGYQVVCAVNGAEGVSKALSEQPDIVLMDMNLPVMDGWEATRRLKADDQTRAIPVMALTANAMASDREEALSAGCDDFDTKPVDMARLLEKMEALISQRATQKPEAHSFPQDDRLQRTLLSYLRHELCTPMNAIIGYSEMLLDELKSQPDSDLFNDLQKIYACGNQLLSLTNSILHPSHLEISQLEQNLDSFSASIRVELLTPLSTVIGYSEMLLEEADPAVAPDIQRIQTAAQRLLAMINDIVTLAEEQLRVIDAEQLSTADLLLSSLTETTLLQSATTTIRSLSQAQSDVLAAASGNVLVVDDNETNCDLLKRQLGRQGYTVTAATSGQEALELVAATLPDLVLLDIVMPKMSGLEVLHRLKTHEDWQHIPVIVISALDEIDHVVQCIEMGAEDYLSKPFKPVLLRAKIAACLEKKRLREQQVLLLAQRLIAEATPVPVMISRLEDGAILYANTTAGSTFQLPSEEMLHRNALDFYCDPSDRRELVAVLSDTETVQHRELQCKRADGTPFWVTASFQILTFNGETTILSALCDITDRKEAEEALRVAEEKFRSIFENALEGIYQSTPDGHFISINPAMARIHGYSSPSQMMETISEIGHQIYVDSDCRKQFTSRLESQGEVAGFEYQAYRQDGEIIWVSESARAVRGAAGQMIYFEGILEDVTERKQKEAALKRQLEELQVEIDQVKLAKQVAEITGTDYFQDLQAQVATLQFEAEDEPGASPISAAAAPPSSAPPSTTPKVLLVEDNEDNRDMLSRRLKRSGYEVMIAVDGQEGVTKTVTEKPDLVLMDMSLPVIDGWEATAQLKANPDTQNIPVIALTAHAMAGDREKAMGAGCDEYDTKPINLPRLLGKIEALIGPRSG